MALEQSRNCPLCGAKAKGTTFPFATVFNGARFSYLQCGNCSSVFVDPIPDSQTFTRMYAKADYHDCHYEGKEDGEYTESAQLLKQFLPAGALVLDYGCGVGAFLRALNAEGFVPYGVEFDRDAAQFAGQKAACMTMSVDDFLAQPDKPLFDAIHLGDVLEHLPDPAGTLKGLLVHLKSGGLLFAEGPLEINPSPVYWAARLFGAFKRIVRPKITAGHPPTHLFRTGAKQQLDFFMRVEPRLSLQHWDIYETGWPYTGGGKLKHIIAGVAIRLSGKRFLGGAFGNRFCGLFFYQQPLDGALNVALSRNPA
jgi:2-polyprenyl-3-methyl-5-hydroxy-6-metoxy-1,4-benzoquinol methylase